MVGREAKSREGHSGAAVGSRDGTHRIVRINGQQHFLGVAGLAFAQCLFATVHIRAKHELGVAHVSCMNRRVIHGRVVMGEL